MEANYCDDFISLASILSQTLEQVSMRALDISNSTECLSRLESGMRELSEAIRDLIERGRVMQPGSNALDHPPDSEPSVPTTAACADWLPADPIDPAADPDPGTRAIESTTSNSAPNNIRAQLDKDLGIDLSEITQPDPVMEAQLDDTQPEAAEQACAAKGESQGEANTQKLQGNNPKQGERFGDLLVDLTNCDANRLESILANPGGKDTAQISELLVRAGLATNAQIMAALEIQAQRRFERACEAKDGDYEFTECLPKPTDGHIHITLTEFATDKHRRPSM